jgi:uncharacterized protein YkwD
MLALVQGENQRMRPYVGAALAVAALMLAFCADVARAGTTIASAGTTTARAAQRSCKGTNLRPSRANAATIDAATLCLIDRTRIAHGLRPLKTNRELQAVAVSQVTDMVRLDYFADDRPTGQTPAALIAATRYGEHAKGLSIGENIGWGTGGYATPAQMVTAWLQSPPHREIILTGEYSDAGVGATPAVPSSLAEGQTGATYALELATP